MRQARIRILSCKILSIFFFRILDFPFDLPKSQISSVIQLSKLLRLMKLLFIYGSPAVGKLTVAKEVAARTRGFKVFHNHLSIDCIKPIFDYGTKPFGRLINLIRVETINEAAMAGQNLIYTFCYAKGPDDAHVKKVIEVVEVNGGEVCFVLLRADRRELDKRVTAESRKKMEKAKSVEMMDFFHETYDLVSPVPMRESLIIDNTNVSAGNAARQIIEHFNLEMIEDSG